MFMKDLLDIHGDPICVGDTVSFIDKDGYLFSGRLIEIVDNMIRYISTSDNLEYERELDPSNCHFEIVKKYKKPDMVSHPPHYQSKTGLEVIDVIEAFTADLKGIEATDTGNIIKYICRWKGKNGLEDLQKAAWYLSHLINHVEEENK